MGGTGRVSRWWVVVEEGGREVYSVKWISKSEWVVVVVEEGREG